MMAPAVAAADTSPARTPARIRVDGTGRKETAGFDTLKGLTYPADLPVLVMRESATRRLSRGATDSIFSRQ